MRDIVLTIQGFYLEKSFFVQTAKEIGSPDAGGGKSWGVLEEMTVPMNIEAQTMTKIPVKSIESYLKGHVEALQKVPMWKDYYQWQLNRGEVASITSWKKLPPEARKQIKRFLKENDVQYKACYYNAYKLCDCLSPPKCERAGVLGTFGYVEGWAHSGVIPMEHGWNTYTTKGGKVYHFDLTAEILFKKTFGDKYFAVLRFDYIELMCRVLRYKVAGEFLQLVFREQKGVQL